ncbi:hypothetical protein APT_00647 [Acetobacter pasteurianus NBRC 101655]|uniref:Uncharacterized protein n=1 Tax=Acetobacter pasteurianus (strain NBRC 105184 / IFO 3283-01) TaxID=634452 RepID=C7JEL8_ACEP3|nr:hypothetical protein APA01_07000 [Acetobacter pasteurianus IFO 3283-01]BAI01899.1 hypothetical protein APA03_07000 [Acetobacter pasteurianus IFO 3283-03]BAI04947.1 hypothetical protein APA07_07000 [Acetobacter pasteurianus IFO 3283-07]BAI07994.1 hypothetical protein APA22_07000 [Acetobacter pasteurianus IFO 3283-22]BAI11042.1 hypothetical protein APA26_07000 [Acetobacter pasteurianus IFO 3283-26]BAI14090.1 hypothetical protein APA32_07000 [Acetobacter pasteurianus IFO 3283-32]BAI17136.1 hy
MKKHSIRKIPSPHNINSAQGTHLGSFFYASIAARHVGGAVRDDSFLKSRHTEKAQYSC